MWLKTGQVAKLLGVAPCTIRRWDRDNQLLADYRTPGGHRRYKFTRIRKWLNNEPDKENISLVTDSLKRRVVTYCRVSSSKQQEDLTRQQQRVEQACEQQGWQVLQRFTDIASGLNDRRKGLHRLLQVIPVLQPDIVVCSYSDRLARFGTRIIEQYCANFNTKIVYLEDNFQTHDLKAQLVKDVLAVLTSFAGKLHRARRGLTPIS